MDRKYYLDFVRTIASLLVLVNHLIERFSPFFSVSENSEISCEGNSFNIQLNILKSLFALLCI
jgi:hypothetical protein